MLIILPKILVYVHISKYSGTRYLFRFHILY
uniref:Uncharacterized protein n=1 Tax=Anguilla anguilla TaxID=7936 RepID=A0A0E9SXA9_ANGAN